VPAGSYRFTVEQGTTWAVAVTVKDLGEAVDLTGYTARLQIRETLDSPTPLLALNSDPGGGITIDGPAGRISWSVADDITASWTWRHGVYDLEIESSGGQTRRLLKGEVVVDREVTR
jgi:hypothetical protein